MKKNQFSYKEDEKYFMILSNIRTLMKYNNISVSKLSKAIGYADTTMYCKIFSGTRGLTIKNLISVANFFKVPLTKLVETKYQIKQELINE